MSKVTSIPPTYERGPSTPPEHEKRGYARIPPPPPPPPAKKER